MIIRESAPFSTPRRVDREAGIIYGVKVVGTKSQNRRSYPLEVLSRAIPLYENAAVNVGHPADNKTDHDSIATHFGAIRNVTARADSEPGLIGDLHYLKSHRLAEQVAEAAERFPERLGLSHNADCLFHRGNDGTLHVERIEKVYGVDLVRRPGTTKGLFESLELSSTMQDFIGTLPIGSVHRATLERLVEDGSLDPAAELSPAEPAQQQPNPADPNSQQQPPNGDPSMQQQLEPPSPEEAIEVAFRTELVRTFDDSSLDATSKLDRIRKTLLAHEKVLDAMAANASNANGGAPAANGQGTPAPAATAPAAAQVKESVDAQSEVALLREEVAKLTARDEVRMLLQECEKTVTVEQFDALCTTPKAARKVLLEGLGTPVKTASNPPAGGQQKPRTTGTSAATGGAAAPAEYERGKNFMEHLIRPAYGNTQERANAN